MIKYFEFNFSPVFFGLEQIKLAAQNPGDSNLCPEIVEYIENLDPDPRYDYYVISPMGASEYYGPNNNYDIFYENALNPPDGNTDYGYKTFETARIFKSHNNKNPDESLGDIPRAGYNKLLHRVEVVARVDKSKAAEINLNIGNNKTANEGTGWGVSMGCKLRSGDRCTVPGCRAVAKNRLEYCTHGLNDLGKVLPSGEIVARENMEPVFFDLSLVEKPAAKESAILKKVASQLSNIPQYRTTLMSDDTDNIKNIKLAMDTFSSKEREISEGDLDRFYFNGGENVEFTTLLKFASDLGIIFKPEEFQYIALAKGGKLDLARDYHKHNIIFPTTYSTINISSSDAKLGKYASDILSPYFKDRTCFEPFLSLRTKSLSKEAAEKNKRVMENPLLLEVSKLYNGYRNLVAEQLTTEKIASTIKLNPEVLNLFLDTTIPEFKIASFQAYSTPEKIAQGMMSKLTKVYIFLA